MEGEAPAEPQGCAAVRVFGFVGDERWDTEQVRGGRSWAWASRWCQPSGVGWVLVGCFFCRGRARKGAEKKTGGWGDLNHE